MKKNHFKDTCIFAVCGVICITLLGISTISFAKSMCISDTDTFTVELDDSLYNSLLSLSSDNQNNSDINNLFVLINGKEYPVIEDKDGQLAAQNAGTGNLLIPPADIPLSDADSSSRYVVDSDGNRIYHIIWGDTLSELALEFGSSVDELAVYNHIPNPNLIYAEGDLYLPK